MNLKAIVAGTCALLCAACAGAPPPPGAGDALKPCPSTPNCVSSRASDPEHRVEPLPLHGSAAAGLEAVRLAVLSLPRTRIVAAGPGYLRAEFTSLVFRFVDDVEFLADESAGVIHVRSASRVGRSDLGVNRRRVEQLRERLAAGAPPAAEMKR
jgi:uncharacterized protein (DUF1499 family)